MNDFGNIFNIIQKKVDKDPYASIHRPGDITIGSFIPYGIPSRIPQFDLAIGHPGIPAGRVVELFGF